MKLITFLGSRLIRSNIKVNKDIMEQVSKLNFLGRQISFLVEQLRH
jgi:hypothetical protein